MIYIILSIILIVTKLQAHDARDRATKPRAKDTAGSWSLRTTLPEVQKHKRRMWWIGSGVKAENSSHPENRCALQLVWSRSQTRMCSWGCLPMTCWICCVFWIWGFTSRPLCACIGYWLWRTALMVYVAEVVACVFCTANSDGHRAVTCFFLRTCAAIESWPVSWVSTASLSVKTSMASANGTQNQLLCMGYSPYFGWLKEAAWFYCIFDFPQ